MAAVKVSSLSFVIVALVTLVTSSCQTNPAPPSTTRTDNSPQTNTEAVKEVSAEKPSLSGEIENLSLYPVPNNRANLAVSLVVTIRNKGVETTAQGWKLAVNAPGRSDLEALDPVHVNGVVEMPGSAHTRVDLGKEDLAIKSKQTPVPKGAMLTGILTFVLPKASEKELSNNKAGLVLHFKDSQGGSYRSRIVTIGAKH